MFSILFPKIPADQQFVLVSIVRDVHPVLELDGSEDVPPFHQDVDGLGHSRAQPVLLIHMGLEQHPSDAVGQRLLGSDRLLESFFRIEKRSGNARIVVFVFRGT